MGEEKEGTEEGQLALMYNPEPWLNVGSIYYNIGPFFKSTSNQLIVPQTSPYANMMETIPRESLR